MPMGTTYALDVEAPYRLDLTVAVLRRFSTNVVDVTGPGGAYVRAFADGGAPAVVAVRQLSETKLEAAFDGPPADAARDLARIRRVIGADARALHFERAAAELPWLRETVLAMRGVRAPRYATLWEACVNAIVYQAVSLFAATAVLTRVIRALSEPLAFAGTTLYAFPNAQRFIACSDATLRAAGLSYAKIAALRSVADELLSGRLDEAMLEARSTPDASARLCAIKGIGPWTAAVILLRGLGRLDLFPEKDSGVAKIIASLGGPSIDLAQTLRELGDERGMLYYYLLLGRLIAAGEVDPSAKPYP
jgi:DNA-3-methyladenine glycosylase II